MRNNFENILHPLLILFGIAILAAVIIGVYVLFGWILMEFSNYFIDYFGLGIRKLNLLVGTGIVIFLSFISSFISVNFHK